MPKVLLPSHESRLVLDMEFDLDDGNKAHNFDLAEGDQVVAHYFTPAVSKQERYLRVQSIVAKKKKGKKGKDAPNVMEYHSDPEACVRDCCTKVEGLKGYEITDGRSLVAHKPNEVLVKIINKIYSGIMGLDDSEDDADEEEI